MSTEEKLDNLIKSVATLTEIQRASQRELDDKLKKLEQDVATAQEDATERAIKRAKRERPYEFRKKGHQEQFLFNTEVADRVEAAAKKLQKLTPADVKQKKIVDEALEELKEGASAIAERQKHIRIADQSEYHWRTVEAYKSGGIADNEEDAKKLKQAEKSAEQEALKEKQKAATAAALAKARRPPPPPPMPPLWPTAIPPRYQLGPAPIGGLPPIPSRPVGPCFNCGQLGHLKLHCPKLARQQYPLHISSSGSVYVDNVKPLTFSGDVGNNNVNVTVTDTACYGGYSNRSECIANVDIVRMSEGGVANNNIFTNVACRLTGDNNINAVTDIVDALCPFTHPCPTISVDELPSAKLCTKSPSSCEMLGVDRDKDLQRELAQSSLNFDGIESDRGLGTPELLGSVGCNF